MNDVWLFYSLMNLKLEQYAHGVAQPGLSVQDLVPLSLPLPPLSLQQSFAAKIEAIEAQKQAVQQSIREVEALLAERMDNYFS
jgi:type I restriction enzyme S subunit